MGYQPRPSCMFITKGGKCQHADMPRKMFGRLGDCVLLNDFVDGCNNQVPRLVDVLLDQWEEWNRDLRNELNKQTSMLGIKPSKPHKDAS